MAKKKKDKKKLRDLVSGGEKVAPRRSADVETDAVSRETELAAVTGSHGSDVTTASQASQQAGQALASGELVERATTSRAAADPVSRETVPLPRPHSPRIIAVANQKGGVGKTTSVVNIAVTLASRGATVLVIDVDPQGNTSTALGVEHQSGTPGTYDVLLDDGSIAELAQDSTEAPRLRVLPASVDLAAAEIQLVSAVAREARLKSAITAYLADHPTDYVFMDCPPSLGLLTLNSLVAATEVMIPIQTEYYALEGVSQLLNTISLVQAEINPELQLTTVLLTMYDARTLLSSQVATEVRNAFPEQTLRTVIPRSVRVAEAPSYGQAVVTYDPRSAGAEAYENAAREIAERGAGKGSN